MGSNAWRHSNFWISTSSFTHRSRAESCETHSFSRFTRCITGQCLGTTATGYWNACDYGAQTAHALMRHRTAAGLHRAVMLSSFPGVKRWITSQPLGKTDAVEARGVTSEADSNEGC